MTEKQGKYGALIRQAREPENHQAVKPENQKTSEIEEMVNLCAKVPKAYRQHWAAESKRSGKSMTQVIIDALTAEFGLPD
jgi:hypothetical protein